MIKKQIANALISCAVQHESTDRLQPTCKYEAVQSYTSTDKQLLIIAT